MSSTYEVFKKLTESQKQVDGDFALTLAYDVAIDLWDGMTKGKVGAELAHQVESYISVMEADLKFDPDGFIAYMEAIKLASDFLDQIKN